MQMTGIALMCKCNVSFISVFNNIIYTYATCINVCLSGLFFFLICLFNWCKREPRVCVSLFNSPLSSGYPKPLNSSHLPPEPNFFCFSVSSLGQFVPLCCGRVHVRILSCVWLFVTLWTVARQTPLSMRLLGKNTGVGCHFLLQRIFLTQGSNPYLLWLLHWQVNSLPLSHLGSSLWKGTNSFKSSRWRGRNKDDLFPLQP